MSEEGRSEDDRVEEGTEEPKKKKHHRRRRGSHSRKHRRRRGSRKRSNPPASSLLDTSNDSPSDSSPEPEPDPDPDPELDPDLVTEEEGETSLEALNKQDHRKSFSSEGGVVWFIDAWDDADHQTGPLRVFKQLKLPRVHLMKIHSRRRPTYDYSRPDEFRFPVHFAAYSGDVAKIDKYCRRGLDLNRGDDKERRPIHFAALDSTAESLYYLLRRPDVDPNVIDCFGLTPMAVAALEGRSLCLRMFLASGRCNEDKPIQVLTPTPKKRHVRQMCLNSTTQKVFAVCRKSESQLANMVEFATVEAHGVVTRKLRGKIRNVRVDGAVVLVEDRDDDEVTIMTPLEIACSKEENVKIVEFLLKSHAVSNSALRRKYPMYADLLRHWERRHERDLILREIVQTEKTYCDRLDVLAGVIGKCFLMYGTLSADLEPEVRKVFTKFTTAVEGMHEGHQRLRGILQLCCPLLEFWNPFPMDYSAPTLPLDEGDLTFSLDDIPAVKEVSTAPDNTWFDQGRVCRTYEIAFPMEFYLDYARLLLFFERELMTGPHENFRTFIEGLSKKRAAALQQDTKLHSVLFEPVIRSTKLGLLLKTLMKKTDRVDPACSLTKSATDQITKFLVEMNGALGISTDTIKQEDLLVDVKQVLARARTDLESVMGPLAVDPLLLCHGRKEDLHYADLVPVKSTLKRSIPRFGECDLFIFSTCLLVCSGRDHISLFENAKVKTVLTWRKESVRITIREPSESEETRDRPVLFDRLIQTPTLVAERWHTALISFREQPEGPTKKRTLRDDDEPNLFDHSPWVHLVHFDDERVVETYLDAALPEPAYVDEESEGEV